MKTVVISGSGLFTPPFSISNEELVAAYNQYVDDYNSANREAIAAGNIEALALSSAEFIESRSGIKSRYVMEKSGILDPKRLCPFIPERSEEETSLQCEIAVKAANEALEKAGVSPKAIDLVIAACSNFQRPYPAIAIEVQSVLGCSGYAFDINVACSSATFGIQVAANAIRSGAANRVLMVNPEICTAHLNFRDRDSHFIFGDAATAVLLERENIASSPNQYAILGTKLTTHFSNNIRNNFGFLNRTDEEGVGKFDKLFHQQGRKVFKEVVPLVVEQIEGLLGQLALTSHQIKRFWLHQANRNMNELIYKRLLNDEEMLEKAPIVLDRYANTSSAGSIIAFHGCQEGLQPGDYGIISSFGAGYSLGSVVLKKIS